jgi:hypothetical protein
MSCTRDTGTLGYIGDTGHRCTETERDIDMCIAKGTKVNATTAGRP